MQHYNLNIPATNAPQTTNVLTERQTAGLNKEMQDAARAAQNVRASDRALCMYAYVTFIAR